MRAELADSGIRVSVLCPGTIMTPMIENGASPERWVGSYSQEKLDKLFEELERQGVRAYFRTPWLMTHIVPDRLARPVSMARVAEPPARAYGRVSIPARPVRRQDRL